MGGGPRRLGNETRKGADMGNKGGGSGRHVGEGGGEGKDGRVARRRLRSVSGHTCGFRTKPKPHLQQNPLLNQNAPSYEGAKQLHMKQPKSFS
jgi:hypothetical protein